MSNFRFYWEFKLSFEHKSVRKNLLLSARFCCISRLSLHELDRKFKFGGTIGYRDSCLELLFCNFKVFRPLSILHVAAEATRADSGKGPGYCYMMGWGPNSCLLGHAIVPLFCFYIGLFLLSNFNSVDFWNSMYWIVIDTSWQIKTLLGSWEIFWWQSSGILISS